MNNPFDAIEARLSNIENLLLDIKHPPASDTRQEHDLLNVEGAADFLSLTVPTIYSKVSKREIPFMKRGNRLYFSKKELVEYLKEGRQKTRQEAIDTAHEHLKRKGPSNE